MIFSWVLREGIIFINCHISVWHLNFEQMEKLFSLPHSHPLKYISNTSTHGVVCPSRNSYENIGLLHTVSFISKIIKVWSSKKGLFHIYNTKASIHFQSVNFNILALKRIAIMYRAGLWHLFSIKVNSFKDSFLLSKKNFLFFAVPFQKNRFNFLTYSVLEYVSNFKENRDFSPGHFTHKRFVKAKAP